MFEKRNVNYRNSNKKNKSIIRKRFFVLLTIMLMFLMLPDAFAEDRLIVKDSQDNVKFKVSEDGRVTLNTDINDAPNWVKLFGAADGDNCGFAFDSYANTLLGAGAIFRFARGTQTARSAIQQGDRLGFFLFGGYDGSSFLNTAGITAKIDGPVTSGNVPTMFAFETSKTGYPREERLVITSTGRIGIGVSSPSYLLHLSGGAYSNGTSWVNSSSRELKENIKALSSNEAMTAFSELQPVKFNYKTNKNEESLGFIAEDVPQLLATNDRKGMDPMDVVAVLTKVVQEQQKTIDQLNNRLEAIEKSGKR